MGSLTQRNDSRGKPCVILDVALKIEHLARGKQIPFDNSRRSDNQLVAETDQIALDCAVYQDGFCKDIQIIRHGFPLFDFDRPPRTHLAGSGSWNEEHRQDQHEREYSRRNDPFMGFHLILHYRELKLWHIGIYRDNSQIWGCVGGVRRLHTPKSGYFHGDSLRA